jgi:hypothetical protein
MHAARGRHRAAGIGSESDVHHHPELLATGHALGPKFYRRIAEIAE